MSFQQPVWKIFVGFSFAVICSVCSISSAYAGLITSDINIVDASITFDDVSSFGETAGDFSVIEGGTTTTSIFAGDTVTTGVNPLLGTLTETDDGIGFSGAADVSGDEYLIGFDSFLSVENSSLVDIYQVFFKLTFSNLVNATGDDAYADSEFVLMANGSEIFFSDLLSDSLYGNEIGGVLNGDFGGEMTESDTLLFDFILNPLDILDLELIWTLEGGEYDNGSSIASFSQFLSVDSVTLQQTAPPQSVPEPTTLLLFAIGILGLGRKNTLFRTK
ncbi:MAG: PEP-CTERM sorting domain-containing protein [Colwellia sp.]|nr:PEP-CTERM sorting domain-containing protein [Colwellia sp.]